MKTLFRLLTVAILAAGVLSGFAAETDFTRLANANNTFAFKLLKTLVAEQPYQNLFVSPYSAATALQMAANGAGGRTRNELQQVLGTADFSPKELGDACRAAQGLLDSQDTNLMLTTANALWYRSTAAVKTNFLELNRDVFQATVKPLDFSNAPAAEAAINQWASDETHGRITGIANGMIDPDTTDMVLANAIYFKGKWEDPFDKSQTQDRTFYPAEDVKKTVPMMAMSKKFTYRKGTGYQAVRLPYMGDNLAMYVFLPDAGYSPVGLLQIMNGDKWRRVTMPGFSERDGQLVLPKFKLEDTVELNRPLEALGIRTAFEEEQADFSGMFGDQHFLSEVRQKTFVEVDEAGTEAAAVTVGGIPMSAGLEIETVPPFVMIVDHPFLFAIVDARNGMILFMGVVNDL